MKSRSEKIRNKIMTLYDGLRRRPSNVAKEHPRLYSDARKVFGSWKMALEACAIDYEKARNHKKWSREKITNEIKRLYVSGHSLRPKDLKKGDTIKLISAATYHFGSWSKAVKQSGIYYSYERNYKKSGKIDICDSEFRTKQDVK